MLNIWFWVFILLLVLEAITVNLVSIWFALGALVSAIVSLFVPDTTVQIVVFLVVSFVSLLATRPLVQKFKSKKDTRLNLDSVVGKIGIVTEPILPNEVGEVRVFGKRWSAVGEEKIDLDTEVEILSIEGVKLHVKKRSED